MPDHQPGAPEDPLHLVVVNRLIAEDAAVEFAGGGVDDGVVPSGAHSGILPLAMMIAGAEDREPAIGRSSWERCASGSCSIERDLSNSGGGYEDA